MVTTSNVPCSSLVMAAHPVATVVTGVAMSLMATGMAADALVPDDLQWLTSLGPSGLLIVLVYAIISGRLRTSQEIESHARSRDRAERLCDELLPRMDRLSDAIEAVLKERTRGP